MKPLRSRQLADPPLHVHINVLATAKSRLAVLALEPYERTRVARLPALVGMCMRVGIVVAALAADARREGGDDGDDEGAECGRGGAHDGKIYFDSGPVRCGATVPGCVHWVVGY